MEENIPKNEELSNDSKKQPKKIETNESAIPKKSVYRSWVPYGRSVTTVVRVAEMNIVKWKETGLEVPNELLTDYEANIIKLKKIETLKESAKSDIGSISFDIDELDEEANNLENKMKLTLILDMGKEKAYANYPILGIGREGSSLTIPSERFSRLATFDVIIAGLDKLGYADNKDFGKSIIEDLKTRYDVCLKSSDTTKAGKSGFVGDKNQLLARVLKTQSAICGMIKLSNRDSYESVLRSWGFLRETY